MKLLQIKKKEFTFMKAIITENLKNTQRYVPQVCYYKVIP